VIRCGQQLGVVLGRQVWRQEAECREIQTPRGEPLENDRKLARHARGLYAAVGRMLGEVQDLDAVREQRRTGLAKIELPRIEFGQVSDETYGRLALASRQVLHLREECVVGELSEVEQEFRLHERNIRCALATLRSTHERNVLLPDVRNVCAMGFVRAEAL